LADFPFISLAAAQHTSPIYLSQGAKALALAKKGNSLCQKLKTAQIFLAAA